MPGLFSSVRNMFSVLEWQGLIAALAISLLVTLPLIRLARPQVLRWGPLLLGLGALAFPPSIALLQVPLQTMSTRWMLASLATANPLIIHGPSILISGVVQEASKAVLALLLLVGLMKRRETGEGLWAGYWTGLGYGAMEAWIVLSAALSAGYGWSSLGGASLERFLVVPLHAALTGIALGWGWEKGTGAGLLAVGGVSLYHALLNYGVVWVSAGLISPTGVLWWIAALSALSYYRLVRLARRQ